MYVAGPVSVGAEGGAGAGDRTSRDGTAAVRPSRPGLVSSKINQWMLLVGILPLVFAISTGATRGLPVDPVQREELLLTAAQSAFAVALVVGGRLTTRGAWALLGLFVVQFVLAWTLPEDLRAVERVGLAAVYLLLAAVLLVRRRHDLSRVLRTGLLARPDAPALTVRSPR